MGYVYVMEADRFCKIGISETCVEQRQRTIQTGCPFKIKRVWCSRNIPDHMQCERILHDYFMDKHNQGEWFEVSFFEAAEKAESVCANGADKHRIEQLEQENKELRIALSRSYTREDIINSFMKVLQKGNN